MTARTRALAGVLAVTGVPLLTIRLLHDPALIDRLGADRLGVDWSDPVRWLDAAPFEVALASGARLVALAMAYAVVTTTLLHLMALVSGERRLIVLTARVTLPVVRRLADRVVAGSLAVSVLAGPAAAAPLDRAEHSPPVETVSAAVATDAGAGGRIDFTAPRVSEGYAPGPYRIEPETVEPPPEPASEDSQPDEPQPDEPQPDEPAPRSTRPPASPPPPQPVAAEGPTTVVVERGDSMWSLAERRIGDRLGRSPSDPEVAPYWRATVDANAGRLRSGDPDLIFPGERIALPDPAGFTPRGS